MTGTSIREQRREAAIERMADHLLEHGLAGASLRPLAAAAGTSDRMLLYYFADRGELLVATLERAAARLRVALDGALPTNARLAPDALLRALWSAARSPTLAPYMRLWLELAAAASRGREPERAAAGAIIDGFAGWIGARIEAAAGTERREAAKLLAMLEGLLLLDAAGRENLTRDAIG